MDSWTLTNEPHPILAVIGGSGFYEMGALQDVRRVEMTTPYGPPSGPIAMGTLQGQTVAFLSRHGLSHTLLPSEVPYRANIWALASLGVRSLVSISAVGSLQLPIEPSNFVTPDQVIDRTTGARTNTFFGEGIVAHVSLDEPYCGRLRSALGDAAAKAGPTVHRDGTLVVIEGPAFSTKAESFLYQSGGASIIGMTAMPEARLAREAGMCYACLACVTDYDTWHDDHEAVTVAMVLDNLRRSVEKSAATVAMLTDSLPDPLTCDCCSSLSTALVTRLEEVGEERNRTLAPILARYL
jgi:5'-methylthioadenosine phosphorylase